MLLLDMHASSAQDSADGLYRVGCNMMARLPRLSLLFAELRDDAAELFPRVQRVTWRPTWEAGETGRAFAFYDAETFEIGLSPRLEHERHERQVAIIRHELGHAIDDLYSRATIAGRFVGVTPAMLPPTPEARADAIAWLVWDEVYGYDEGDVQCLGADGPRPSHLPR
jgi:hypothetical protein